MFFYSFVTYLSRIADDFHCFSIFWYSFYCIGYWIWYLICNRLHKCFVLIFLLFHSEKIKTKSCFQFCLLSASAFDWKKDNNMKMWINFNSISIRIKSIWILNPLKSFQFVIEQKIFYVFCKFFFYFMRVEHFQTEPRQIVDTISIKRVRAVN